MGGAPTRVRSRDWTLRLFEASPVGTGLALVLGYFALAVAWRAASRPFAPPDAIVPLPLAWELVNGLTIAVPLTANAVAQRGALRDLRELAPAMEGGAAGIAALCDPQAGAPRAWLALASGAACLVMLLVVFFDPTLWGSPGRPGARDPELYWSLFHNVASGYVFGRIWAMEVSLTRGFARIAERVRIDLLDQAPLAPFARKGQRSAWLWILVSSCVSLFWLGGQPSLVNGLALAIALGTIALAFGLPLARVQRRIAAAKRSELLHVNRLLAQERLHLAAGGGRMADLVAWRGLVESVREWPVNTGTLLRSGLFVLLGVGSWLGGAVVDRLLDAALPR
jgi:hypothetical protein